MTALNGLPCAKSPGKQASAGQPVDPAHLPVLGDEDRLPDVPARQPGLEVDRAERLTEGTPAGVYDAGHVSSPDLLQEDNVRARL